MSESDLTKGVQKYRFYEFGEFCADSIRRALFKNGEEITLPTKAFELLLLLVKNEGQVLSHDNLLKMLWQDSFVEQNSLKKAVSDLRKALNDSTEKSLYIKTIPRQGYCLAVPVRVLPDENVLIQTTDTQIVIEEIEEFDDKPDGNALPKIVETMPADAKLLPAPKETFFDKLRRHKIAAAASAIIALGLIIYGVQTFYFSGTPYNFSIENTRITRLTSEGDTPFGAISADGNYITYITQEKDSAVLCVKQLATGVVSKLAAPANAQFWFYTFTPDSNYVYYSVNHPTDPAQTGLYQVAVMGAAPRRISDEPVGLAFSPDGKQVAFVRVTKEKREHQIVVANADLSGQKQVALYPENFRVWSVNWSPDGENLLLALRKQVAGKLIGYITEIPASGGAEKIIKPERETIITAAIWLPDKKSLLMGQINRNAAIHQIWQYFPSSDTARRVTNDANSYNVLSLTRDGKSLVSTQESRLAAIWTGDADGKNLRQIAGGASSFDHVEWTADNRLVYSTGETGEEQIWIMSADGSNKRQLTVGSDGRWIYPFVSQSGNQIIFKSNRSGAEEIWRMDLDGGSLAQLTSGDRQISHSKLLADGQTLFFSSYTAPFAWVLYKQIGDGQPVRLNDTDTDEFDISPDGKLIAFSALDKRDKKSRVFVRQHDGGSEENIKTFDFEPVRILRWTRDGKALAYAAFSGNSGKIIVQPLDGGEPKIIAEFPGEEIFWFDFSPDGSRLVLVRGKTLADAVLIKAENGN